MPGVRHVTIDRLTAALADRYHLERELGAGGMATVYLAHDLKHDRKVALKVLKPELAAVLGAERFVVEIKTTAALQHPHILPLFDSGTVEGFLFYVMPYIEGETLRGKLDRERQFGIEEAVRITTEVADALDYAHRHGVIHRDIKPENILLHDGRPMVADFGIALALSAAAGGRMTETGLSLGTPHYMSPEQATAEREITGRSDVYSLASVLYEMLAGDPPHTGSTAQQIIMKIVTDQARPVTDLRRSVPPHVAWAVGKALEKLPADRFATAAEFAAALKDPAATMTLRSAAPPPPPRRRQLVGAVLVALAVGAIGWMAALWWSGGRTGTPVVVRYDFDVASTILSTSAAIGTNLAVAPDGRAIAYIQVLTTGVPRIYYRRLEDAVAQPIPGSEGAQTPGFSPDGKWIAYMVGNVIWKIQVTGGTPVQVGPTDATPVGLTWTSTGQIFTGTRRGLVALPAAGGAGVVVASPDTAAGELYFNQPRALPDGKTVLFSIQFIGGLTRSRIAAYSLVTKTVTRLDLVGFDPLAYIDGTLVYALATGAINAVPVDLATGKVKGSPVALGPTVLTTVAGASESALSST
ncbi:MAG TPA: protein kinase, partial [Gemmatimonadales bacterium]|nr:protein kinase [Gemmatimonadales bacterium]